jgi:CBS domain-containing protein
LVPPSDTVMCPAAVSGAFGPGLAGPFGPNPGSGHLTASKVGEKEVLTAMAALVDDVMTRAVISVRKSAEYKDILQVMRHEHFSAFPVLDQDDRVVGVVSEDDLLVKEEHSDAGHGPGFLARRGDRMRASALTAADLMTRPAVTISPAATVAAAARIMHAKRIRRLPVVTSGGKLVGIVSRSDLLGVYDRPDDDIRSEIEERVIKAAFGLDDLALSVTVAGGVVALAGQVEREPVALSLLQAVRQIDGVIGVRAKFSCPRR